MIHSDMMYLREKDGTTHFMPQSLSCDTAAMDQISKIWPIS